MYVRVLLKEKREEDWEHREREREAGRHGECSCVLLRDKRGGENRDRKAGTQTDKQEGGGWQADMESVRMFY